MGILDPKDGPIYSLDDFKIVHKSFSLKPIIHFPPEFDQAKAAEELAAAMYAKIEADVLNALAAPVGILNATTTAPTWAHGTSMIADVLALCHILEQSKEPEWPVSDDVLRRRLAAEFGDTDPRTASFA